jgi:hypothetical protein
VLGVACVACLLGLAANITLGLWTRSTVDAVVYDAARDIATTPSGTDRAAAADLVIGRATDSLGVYGDQVLIDVESLGGGTTVLRVRAPGVELLPAMIGGGPTVGDLDRRIVVRNESP